MKNKKTQKQIEAQIDEAVRDFYPKYIDLIKERQELLERRRADGHVIQYMVESVEEVAKRIFI